MHDDDQTPDGASVHAYLEGGPADFPEAERRRWVPAGQRVVKVPHGAGYMHFERDPDAVGAADCPVVFRLSMLTRIAE